MDRLEEIVSALEGERLPLDSMVSSYEEGMKLLQLCRRRLETARQRVEQIATRADGSLEVEPFEPAEAGAPAAEKPKAAAPASPAPARRRAARPDPAPEGDGDDIRLF